MMKRMLIILWAGSVVCGACSIKKRTERTHTAATTISHAETRSVSRQDTLQGSLGRVVQVNRSWVAESPRTGTVYRYRERIRLDDKQLPVQRN